MAVLEYLYQSGWYGLGLAGAEGVSQVAVQNGNWYSLLWTYSAFDGSNFTPVRQPGSLPIPEPATMAVLGLGMVLVMRKK